VQAGVVEADGKVRLADVTVGRDYGTTVEVVHGLAETDNVIINPSDSLEAGIQVRIAKAEAEGAKPAHE
jgi:multidrug efflux pump subunit AcrA (membrane-fusion protein)